MVERRAVPHVAMSSLAVYCVVHEGVLRFLPEFWRSLEPQLDGAFRLYLSLDGVSVGRVREVIGRAAEVTFIPADPDSTPSTLRARALRSIVELHQGVVLLDCDDVLLQGRLTAAREALNRFDVYGCTLELVDEKGSPVTKELFGPTTPVREPHLEESMARSNVFGFSNTAYRSAMLKTCLEVEPNTIAMDWLVASRAYMEGASFTFDPTPRMRYRQYGSNTATVLPPFAARRVLADARLVAEHFRFLLGSAHGTERPIEPFAEAYRLAVAFLEWLESRAPQPAGSRVEGNLEQYCARLNARPFKVYTWWEHVAAVPVFDPKGKRRHEIIDWSPK